MDALFFLKIIIPAFFAILFLQSGLDKVFDWKGNVEFHREHFAQSPLRNAFLFNLGLVAVLEICAGLLCALGAFYAMLKGETFITLLGLQLAAVIFTMLFFGQRISKDYAGAATIVTYFILNVVSLVVLGMLC